MIRYENNNNNSNDKNNYYFNDRKNLINHNDFEKNEIVNLSGYLIYLAITYEGNVKLYGSSADKSDLQIGDEILEINGQNVDTFDHAQIISHIHNCIRERKITLKVKRSTKTNELCINDNIKEAFIIGVDEQAKERLNNLTKSKQVTPIDIEDLSHQLDNSNLQESIHKKQQLSRPQTPEQPQQTVTLHKEYYIVDNMVKQQPQQQQQQQQQQQTKNEKNTSSSSLLQIKNKIIHSYNSSTSKRQAPIAPVQLTPNQSPIPEQQQQHQQNNNNNNIIKRQSSNIKNDAPLLSSSSSGSSSTSSTSSTSSNSSAKSVKLSNTTNTNDIELTVITNRVQSNYTPPITPSTLTSPASSSISSPALQPTSYLSDDEGQIHREMPIDCPDNFVAEVKTKPTYPPVVITTQTTFTTFKTPKPDTSKQDNKIANNKSTTNNNNTSMQYIDDTNSETKLQISTPNINNTRKLIDKQKINQQEDVLRKIKDDEELILRNSLRNSEKLRKLEVDNNQNDDENNIKIHVKNVGRVNNGFINDDENLDNSDIDHIGLSSSQDEDSSDPDLDIKQTRFNMKKAINRIDSLDEYGELEVDKYKNELLSSPSNNKKNDNLKKTSYTMDTIDSGNGFDIKFDDNKLLKTLDISDLFSQVDYIQTKLQQSANKTINDDIILLRKLYQTSEFQNALTLYNKIVNLNTIKRIKPICENSYNLTEEIMKLIETAKSMTSATTSSTKTSLNRDTNELCLLLSKLNIKTILQTHDKISSEYYAKSDDLLMSNSQLNDESSLLLSKAEYYCVENLKLVNIDKTDTPLGATIRNQDGRIVIGRIVKGGAADLSGLLHEEDEILEINSVAVRGKTINDVSEMLSTISGTVTFLVIPQMENGAPKTIEKKLPDVIHIRSLFNYEPDEDLYIPCKELGLRFLKGDILHIISQEDNDWWQAYKDGEKEQSLAGLIPSQSFQERRLSQMQALIGDSFMDRSKHKKNGLCVKGLHKNKRRRIFEGLTGSNLDEIVTYEEVVLFKPPVNRKRPIVLIGPHSIGRHELRKRLMQSNPSLYEVAVPHTTRAARRDEIDGKDYHFIARHIFEADIKQNRFIEHGEFEKNLYGTSRDAIKKVIDNGKICVLNLYPQALKTLRSSDLMPFVIYIGPPSLAKLKELKTTSNESFKENDLLDIIDKGREIEELYGHYFDKIIRNTDMDKTYTELVETIEKVENEENWVPAIWLKN